MCFKKKNNNQTETINANVTKKKKWPIILSASLAIIAALILFLLQSAILFFGDIEYVTDFLASVESILDDNTELYVSATNRHKATCQDFAIDIAAVFSDSNYNEATEEQLLADCKDMKNIAELVDSNELYIVDAEGKVLVCIDDYEFGKNIISDLHYFTEDEFKQLHPYDYGTLNVSYNTETGEYESRVSPLSVYDDDTFATIDYYCFPLLEYNEEDETAYANYYVIMGESYSDFSSDVSSFADLGALLDNSSYDNRTYTFAINKNTDTFAYYVDVDTDEILTSQPVNLVLSDAEYEEIKNLNGTTVVTIGDDYYYINSLQYSSIAYPDLVICMATKITFHDRFKIVLWSSILFLILEAIIIAYATFLKDKGYRSKRLLRKMLVLALACFLVLSALTFYLLTLDSLNTTISKSEYNEEILAKHIAYREAAIKQSSDYYKNQSTKILKVMAYMYADNMNHLSEGTDYTNYRYYVNDKGYVTDNSGNRIRSYVDNQYMKYINTFQNISSSYIINNNCKTVFTSGSNWYYEISRDPTSETYAFSEVLDRKTDSYYSIVETESGTKLTVAVHLRMYAYSEDGVVKYGSLNDYENNPSKYTITDGVLVGVIDGYDQNITSEASILDYAVNTVEINGGSTLLLIDKDDTTKFIYKPSELEINNVSDLQFPEDVFTSDYTGFTTIHNVDYFACVSLFDAQDAYLVSLYPTSMLYTTRNRVTVYTAIVSLISFVILSLLFFLVDRKNYSEVVYTNQMVRLPNQMIPWSEKTSDEKLATVIKYTILLIGLFVVVNYFRTLANGNSDTIIGMLLSNNYRKGVNIFSISACILIIFVVLVCVNCVSSIFKFISSSFGTKTKAITKLILSILQYSGIVFAFLYSLYLFGFDMTKIITAVGILGTVVGVGSKTIINDLVAGIFLITEDSFKVGDIVNIGGFRGTVQEIGLRTTSVVDSNNNVKIIANSSIQGIVNMSKNLSTANCSLTLTYDMDLDEVDKIVQELLPKLREENGNIVGNLTSIFTNLKENGSTLVISAEVFEKHRIEVGNFINRRMLELLGEKNIKVMSTAIVELNQ